MSSEKTANNPEHQTWWQRRSKAEKIGIVAVGAAIGVGVMF